MTPRQYPREVPALDAPPRGVFQRCHCGALLLARVWHNRTEAEEAHWELLDPPVTAARGLDHACEEGAP
jgi:hypothetical protein